MDNFYVQDGQFWLNDTPLFIHAAEFHYFRTPKDQWRQRLDLLKAAGFNTLATYIPWLWHQVGEDVSDFDGHSHPLRDLEGFLDLVADMGFLIIARPGPYIMAETINEGIPRWVFSNYPQAAFIDQDNKTQNIASYLHPDFLACVKKWYQAIFDVLTPRQITRGGKIIMVQLDNEMGMIAWVRNIMDTNPDTVERFAKYLWETYGENLSGRYLTGDLAGFLRDGMMHPTQAYAEKIAQDYMHFYRGYLRDYTTFLWSEANAQGLEVPPVINIHGFANGGKTFPIGLSQLIEVMRMDGMLSATDVYPLIIGEGNFHQLLMVNEITKALQNKQQALFSIEFQSGGKSDFSNSQSSLYDLHSRLCISSGMRAINHYLFTAGENDPILSPVKRHDWGPPIRTDGKVRQHYHRYAKLSKALDTYGTDLVISQPKTSATIGFLLDYFMTEYHNELTREATNMITHQREDILFDFFARGLSLTHRFFNALEISSSDLDVLQTPTLFVMIERQCDAATQQKLVDYVEKGGKLILAGRMCVEDFKHNECTILKDAIGIRQIAGGLPWVQDFIEAFDYSDVPASFVETYSGDFDEVFARRGNGDVAGYTKTIGKGKVMHLGATVITETLEDLDIFHRMADRMGCYSPFNLSNWADVRLSKGEDGGFLFITNYDDDPVQTTVEYEKHDLFGGNSIYLPARRGFILPVDWKLNNGILIHYVTSEINKVKQDGNGFTLKTDQDDFYAEFSLSGYTCDGAIEIQKTAERQRVKLHGKEGLIVLRGGSQ